jgi:hypothetical protein
MAARGTGSPARGQAPAEDPPETWEVPLAAARRETPDSTSVVERHSPPGSRRLLAPQALTVDEEQPKPGDRLAGQLG